jgi:hypothetical protein
MVENPEGKDDLGGLLMLQENTKPDVKKIGYGDVSCFFFL